MFEDTQPIDEEFVDLTEEEEREVILVEKDPYLDVGQMSHSITGSEVNDPLSDLPNEVAGKHDSSVFRLRVQLMI